MKSHIKQLIFCILLLSFISLNAQSKSDTEDQIYTHLMHARDLKGILDYSEALKHCDKALALSIKINDKENEAITYRIMGDILILANQLDLAIEKLNTASRIQKSNEYKEELAKTRNAQGLAHTELGNYVQAENYFDDGLRIYQTLSLFSNRTNILKNKGKLYLRKEDFKIANSTFDQAYKKAKKYAQEHQKADILLFKSQALNELQERDSAINTCTQAIEIGIANKYRWIITEGYKTLSNIHEANGNPKKAIELLKTHNKILDSMSVINLVRLDAESRAKLNFTEQDELIERQEEKLKQTEKDLKSQTIISFLGLAFLILFFSFIIFLYNNNQKRKKANSLLQSTNSQLTLAKDEAEKATKAKANFLSTITHELRTPLYTVTGLTDLLLDEDPTESQKGYLKSLRFSGDYLLNFINDILDVNKIEANKVEIEKIPFDLKKLTEEVLFTQNKAAKDNNTKLHLNFDENVPEYLLGDSTRVSQVLINLVSNAIKFTKNGDVNLNVKKTSASLNSLDLLIEVKDNGIGISYDKQDEIFESFSQGSVQINRKYGGTGLGLTIVKNLIELMGSKIQLKSQPNVGTTFYFGITFDLAKRESIDTPKELTFSLRI